MIWRSRSLSSRSAISIALSRSGSSGRASAGVLTKRSESQPSATCDGFGAGASFYSARRGTATCRRGSCTRRQSSPSSKAWSWAALSRMTRPAHRASGTCRPPDAWPPAPRPCRPRRSASPGRPAWPGTRRPTPENGSAAHRLAHQRRQTLHALAEVDRLGRHQNPDVAGRSDHEVAFSARITASIRPRLRVGPDPQPRPRRSRARSPPSARLAAVAVDAAMPAPPPPGRSAAPLPRSAGALRDATRTPAAASAHGGAQPPTPMLPAPASPQRSAPCHPPSNDDVPRHR